MSKSASKAMAKARKKAKAVNKANQKKFTIFCICFLILITAAAAVIYFRNQNKAEIYSYGGQTVQLSANGTFSARLSHGVNKSGTYIKKTEGSRTLVLFNVDGNEETGVIENNALRLPNEWDDGHGHGSVFPRQTDN